MKNIFTLLLACSLSSVGFAQETKKDTVKSTVIKVYTPQGQAKNSASSSSSYSWVVKTDLLKFATGEIPLIYERKISNKFSVEGAAGVTYSFFENDYTSLIDDESDRFDSKAAIGSVFRGTLKYYPSSDYDAIEGWSFGLQFFHKTNNRTYDEAENGSYSAFLNGKKDSKIRTGIALIISQQLFQDSNICFESFIGIGYANVKSDYYTNGYNEAISEYEVSQVKTDEGNLNVQFGFRIGFGN
ncbi:hypothetical protein [Flavobacterium tegetincola]|uniref:hypothetical protein n=1 Tax=Flavobacterium tegetincola TaxID=150172 RepID=UPI00041EECAB|nr:hypothetical protein [Flavobacterium tegetincola]